MLFSNMGNRRLCIHSPCRAFIVAFVLGTTNLHFENLYFKKGVALAEPMGTVTEPDFAGPISNVTVALGREAKLSCVVDNLGHFKVGWMKADTQTILSLHQKVVTHNTRVSVNHEEPRTWNLHIRLVQEDDRGCYMCQINTSTMKKTTGCIDVHVPPDIIDSESSNDVKVSEGGDVSLKCQAKGYPDPSIIWKREDGEKIILRTGKKEKTKVDQVEGSTLNLTRVNKRHMGAYQCIANNGVPPAVVKRIEVDVHFAPSIAVPNQLVGAPLGSNMEIRCTVEASPKPITFWERVEPREIIMNNTKYTVYDERRTYKTTMTLVVKNLTIYDYGMYLCIARNSIDAVQNQIRTYKIEVAATEATVNRKSKGGSGGPNRADKSHSHSSSGESEGMRSSSLDQKARSSGYKKKKLEKDFISSHSGDSSYMEDQQRDRTYLPPSSDVESSSYSHWPRTTGNIVVYSIISLFISTLKPLC